MQIHRNFQEFHRAFFRAIEAFHQRTHGFSASFYVSFFLPCFDASFQNSLAEIAHNVQLLSHVFSQFHVVFLFEQFPLLCAAQILLEDQAQEVQQVVLGTLVADIGDDCIGKLVFLWIFFVVSVNMFLMRAIEVDAAPVSIWRLEAEPNGVDL